MRIAVCLSRLPDPDTVEVDPFGGGIDFSRTLHMMNPADAVALETALSLRGEGDTVTALTVGPEEAEAVLRDALAVGADEVLRLWEEGRAVTRPAVTSLLIATALRTEGLPDLVICGARSVAGGSGKVPALLAEYLGWPVVTDVLEFGIRAARVRFQRKLPRGARSEGEVTLPAVLGVEPSGPPLRYASLPGLMKAKRAAIPVHYLPELGLSPADLNFPTSTVHAAMPPYPRPRQIFIPDSDLSPEDRVAQIMSAGVAQKSGKVVSGSPEEMADRIIAFLCDHGFVDRPS
jgi:electron transfer flavoprotein beta subunit